MLYGKKIGWKSLLAVLAALALMLGSLAALADGGDLYDLSDDPELLKLLKEVQANLNELNYLRKDSGYHIGHFDDPTWQAVVDFCSDYNISTTDDIEVILGNVYDRIKSARPSPKPDPTPSPEEQFPIGYGEVSDQITEIQTKLYKAGYFESKYTPGLYDDATNVALAHFCEDLNINYSGLVDRQLYQAVMNSDPNKPAPEKEVWQYIVYGSQDNRVKEIQDRLIALQYLRESDLGREYGTFGDTTLAAVRVFCENNEGAALETEGIGEALYKAITDPNAKPCPTPRQPIHLYDKNETVRELKRRLRELGYYKGYVDDECDEEMLKAVADFAEQNGIRYNPQNAIPVNQEIDLVLQDEILTNEKAKPYEAPKEPGFLESMPTWALVLIIAAVVGLLTFALIKAFGGKKGGGTSDAGSSSWPGSSSLNNSMNGGNNVEFEINYQGRVRNITVSIDKPFNIGRGEGTLPLDTTDSDISRKHCRLYFRNGALFLRDYSTNGTRVNGVMQHNCECVVNDYDTITIGHHDLRVHIL